MDAFSIVGSRIAPGTRETVSLPVPRLYTHAELDIPLHVVHGRRPGPTLFVSAAVHGDEINGVEIIRRLLRLKILDRLRGTLIAVPVVNVFGFIYQSRYLPDRRDLNRSFPGSRRGSLAARMAKLFVQEIVAVSTYGIDLHTGSNHRTNRPQIRASLDDAGRARHHWSDAVDRHASIDEEEPREGPEFGRRALELQAASTDQWCASRYAAAGHRG